MAETKNLSSLMNLPLEELYKNGGPLFIFLQLKKHGIETEMLRKTAAIILRDDKKILERVLDHLK